MVRVGVAMLQGARHEHSEALAAASQQLGIEIEVVELRMGKQVNSELDCLVLPGGESTAMRKASQSESLLQALFSWMEEYPERTVLGTCAGAILLAQPELSFTPFIDCHISRNAWGRQRDSFEAMLEVNLDIPVGSEVSIQRTNPEGFHHQPLPVGVAHDSHLTEKFHGVFIRAPRFEQNSIRCVSAVKFLEETVGVLDGNRLALTFHPELTGDYRFHRWLLKHAIDAK